MNWALSVFRKKLVARRHEFQELFSPSPFSFANSDAAQQACDGSRRRRLGDICWVFAETRPVPNAADFPSGWENISDPEQVSDHQGYEPRQLLGCFCPLQNQKGD